MKDAMLWIYIFIIGALIYANKDYPSPILWQSTSEYLYDK